MLTLTKRCILFGSINVYPFVEDVEEDALIVSRSGEANKTGFGLISKELLIE